MNKINFFNKTLRPCYTRTYKKRRSPLLREQNVKKFSPNQIGNLPTHYLETNQFKHNLFERGSKASNNSKIRFWAFAALIFFLTIIVSLAIVIQIANKNNLTKEINNNNTLQDCDLEFDLGFDTPFSQLPKIIFGRKACGKKTS
ncbi:hypothetical protein M0813_20800 [Anaeramoeba flamelloides]|uniref:Uncharacterized protein n=1 Tax=Anaeramoeba flamelloides TaxID=1746091 RepID=A0ABQ8YJE4_9EUKA|nr:hypothetical protein M0813_20800 [Anaeramoeba flamelloides]